MCFARYKLNAVLLIPYLVVNNPAVPLMVLLEIMIPQFLRSSVRIGMSDSYNLAFYVGPAGFK